LEETIRDALRRSDIVISTGGLGPTEDDITRKVSARAVGRELVFREDVLAEVAKRFEQMKRQMPEINRRQAFVIEGARVLPNPNGSAAGMSLETEGKFFVILPGPPRENKPMFENFVLPKLRESAGEIFVKRRILRVAGMGESAVDERIAPIYLKYENPQTTILFNRSEIEIHLTAQGKTENEVENLLDEVAGEIAATLGSSVFSVNDETMEEVIGKLLTENGKTVALAESCTGGLIAERLTEVSGSSRYFIEGVVAYANEAKTRTLNVPADLIEKHGAVSVEVAEAMAKGMRERAQTDYAVSVTGIAGPGGGSLEKPVGLVFIGFASEMETTSIKINLPGDRYLIRWRASQAAFDFLRRKILKKHE
ncbi:MAG: competence/damage-inducible protein A, partial [Acidobacteriota bacterium]|nr:competence/damage-inducible protein A [Acidobacteriota bacterium]